MKPEFLENYRNEHEDTLDARTYDFDWADLERRLGEAEEQDTETCRRTSELMREFLREHLTKDGIELNEDGFEMLCTDFFCSHHYYTRADEYKKKNS